MEKARETTNEEIKKVKKKYIILMTIYFVILVVSMCILFFAIMMILVESKDLPLSYFQKEIKKDISTVIRNGAKLDVVKHIYATREIKERKLAIPFTKKVDDYYPEPTPLSIILNDLKKEYYIEGSKDSTFLKNLLIIIAENEEINPFDKLASNQKFMFENVRQKLDTNYFVVREDLNRIADEMNNKNLLVNEYLAKSNLSYWISIFAIAITIILSIIQIFQNRKKDKTNKEKSVF